MCQITSSIKIIEFQKPSVKREVAITKFTPPSPLPPTKNLVLDVIKLKNRVCFVIVYYLFKTKLSTKDYHLHLKALLLNVKFTSNSKQFKPTKSLAASKTQASKLETSSQRKQILIFHIQAQESIPLQCIRKILKLQHLIR